MSSGRTGPYFLLPKSMQKAPKAFPLWNLPSKGRATAVRVATLLDEPYWPLHSRCVEFWQGIFISASDDQWRSRVQRGSASKSALR